jgi:DNA primase
VRVATLPPGEDPDSLVRAGGVEALDGVLRDAVDLLERKIQLLERKGWFEGVEHRRDALDRLLPTIRAAADPITRELYLSLTAQRAGVSKDVLEHELTTAPAPRIPESTGPRSTDSRSVAPRMRGRRNPETQLLAALLASPEWIARAREEVAPSLLESARLREVFEALLRSDAASGQMPETLSPEAAAAWSYLKEAAQDRDGQEAATLYDRAAQILRARPHYRVMDALTDPGEKRQQRAALRSDYPAADEWYVYQKAAFKEARKAKGSRGA